LVKRFSGEPQLQFRYTFELANKNYDIYKGIL